MNIATPATAPTAASGMNPTTSPGAAGQPALRHADAEPDVRACHAAMLELRPHLTSEADFLERVTRQRGQGYRLLAAWQDGEVVALAGYRIQESLVYGRFLYVDDLVTLERSRGQRWGEHLLAALTEVAREADCVKLVLDTAMSNALAQRFYFRQGLLTGTLRFSKVLN
jgi:ribosomal protein S18 acetylase RimI-like enzyme